MLHHTSNVGLILSPFFPTFKKWLVAVFRPHLGRHIAEVGPKDIYIYYTSNIIWTKHVVFKYLGLHMHTHIHISTIKEKKRTWIWRRQRIHGRGYREEREGENGVIITLYSQNNKNIIIKMWLITKSFWSHGPHHCNSMLSLSLWTPCFFFFCNLILNITPKLFFIWGCSTRYFTQLKK